VWALWAGIAEQAEFIPGMLRPDSDPWGYYHFLPATIGTHEWRHLPWTHTLENGNHLGLFPIGTAILQAPFFYASAGFAALVCCPVDGYSVPFAYGQIVAAACYAALGCLLLFLSLRRGFSMRVALLTPLLLYGGTNLYFYTVHAPGMSHVYAFFVMCLLLYLTLRMSTSPSGITLALLIVTSGLLVLIRPLNAVALLFPLFYGAPLQETLQVRIGWVRRFPASVAMGVAAVLALWLPQLLYWRTVTGDLLVFTYGKKGEGFDWLHPHLGDVLLSHQNGWFVYTPLMALVMVVLLWHTWKGTPGARLVLVVWGLVWYTYASWWCWWLGGSFGHRGFVEYLALLALPLAWGLDRLFRYRRGVWEVALIALGLLVFVNIQLSDLYQWPWEGPDWNWTKVRQTYVKALFP
jgi:hypothetical protein